MAAVSAALAGSEDEMTTAVSQLLKNRSGLQKVEFQECMGAKD
jgi:hypothetical protein